MILSTRNDGFSAKKWRFLKLILLFVGIIKIYNAYFQHFICDAENKRFSSSKDNALENIRCICGQNRHFVEFIHWHPLYSKSLFITSLLGNKSVTYAHAERVCRLLLGRLRMLCEAERDKSRPYACRIACFPEDCGT